MKWIWTAWRPNIQIAIHPDFNEFSIYQKILISTKVRLQRSGRSTASSTSHLLPFITYKTSFYVKLTLHSVANIIGQTLHFTNFLFFGVPDANHPLGQFTHQAILSFNFSWPSLPHTPSITFFSTGCNNISFPRFKYHHNTIVLWEILSAWDRSRAILSCNSNKTF